MKLNDDPPKKSVELGACPILALDVVPLAIYTPAYIDQVWDVDGMV
jgi:hypothetical protein